MSIKRLRPNGQPWYTKLTDNDILRLLREQVYTVDLHKGVVYGQMGRPLAITMGGRQNDRPYVKLYQGRKHRTILVSRLVWMAGARRPIPPGFQVHHRNQKRRDNRWGNLLCVHKLDHDKLHAAPQPDEEGITKPSKRKLKFKRTGQRKIA